MFQHGTPNFQYLKDSSSFSMALWISGVCIMFQSVVVRYQRASKGRCCTSQRKLGTGRKSAFSWNGTVEQMNAGPSEVGRYNILGQSTLGDFGNPWLRWCNDQLDTFWFCLRRDIRYETS